MSQKTRPRRIASDEAHAWARNLRLGNPLAKLLLCMLALYVNGEGECFVGINQLADDCEMDRKTVMSRLEMLENSGAIRRRPQWLDNKGNRNCDGVGRRTTDMIGLLFNGGLEKNSPPDEIQASGPPDGPQRSAPGTIKSGLRSVSGPLAVHLGGLAESSEPELEKKEAVAVAVDARAREPLVSPAANDLADEIAVMVGIEPQHPPPAWCGAAMHVEKWLREGWPREIILIGVRAVMAKNRSPPRSIRFFEARIAEEIGRQQTPLPRAEAGHAQIAEDNASDWRQRRDRKHEALAELRAFNDRVRERGSGD